MSEMQNADFGMRNENLKAACRARSRADFISKMGIVEEEVDGAAYWLDLLLAGKLVTSNQIQDLQREADEITAIVVASIKNLVGRDNEQFRNPQSEFRN
ncbi:MAG: four helix bundle protein [Candidatus Poribacteria bacterium]